jgi:enolase
MRIQKIEAKSILDSRKEETVEILVETTKGKFVSAAPCGKSTGRFEAKPYVKSIQGDIDFLNKIKDKDLEKIKIEEFKDLVEIEGFVNGNIGANSLFALEASVLKALASESGQELWEYLVRGKPGFPYPVGNSIGGGLHTEIKGKRADFQEFLFINKSKKFFDRVFINRQAYKIVGELLNSKEINDEGAWKTHLEDEKILELMNKVQEKVKEQIGEDVEIGVDIAASTFYTGEQYYHRNKPMRLSKTQQINYISELVKKYGIFYLEDPLEEEDFSGFSEITKRSGCMVVGDDLTVTNMTRLKKAVQNESIKALIVKPNQNGSLLKVKEIIDFCKKNEIKTIISHRSGETMDTTIADLGAAWKTDFIKTGVFGKVREAKLNRLINIEKSV